MPSKEQKWANLDQPAGGDQFYFEVTSSKQTQPTKHSYSHAAKTLGV